MCPLNDVIWSLLRQKKKKKVGKENKGVLLIKNEEAKISYNKLFFQVSIHFVLLPWASWRLRLYEKTGLQ